MLFSPQKSSKTEEHPMQSLKKTCLIALCLSFLFGTTACRRADHTTETVADTQSAKQGTTDEAAMASMACLRSVLEDKTPLQGNGLTLSQQVDMRSAAFALVDMDQDGVSEAVVQDLENVVVLYYDGELVYGGDFTFRTMYNIQKDGRHGWTEMSAEGHRYGESRPKFDGAALTEDVLWMIENDGEPNAKYYLRGKEVAQEELQQYLDAQIYEEIEFLPLNAENIRAAFEQFSK
jgi:hypothetical protein